MRERVQRKKEILKGKEKKERKKFSIPSFVL